MTIERTTNALSTKEIIITILSTSFSDNYLNIFYLTISNLKMYYNVHNHPDIIASEGIFLSDKCQGLYQYWEWGVL